MRVIFVSAPSKAYGEINSLVSLAKAVKAAGGEVWFLASPLAAEVARMHFPGAVFQLTPQLEENQTMFRRIVKKFSPDLVLLSELYEVLRPQRRAECPLVDTSWLRDAEQLDCAIVFVDFIAHVPSLRSIASCDGCARRFGEEWLESFLQRLWVILPCPLNEPGPVRERCGVPYRTHRLPLRIDPHIRRKIRARFMGQADAEDGALIVRTGSSWQADLAEKCGQSLYESLGDLLGLYIAGLPRPTTLVSVSSRTQVKYGGKGLQVHNVRNLPPDEFDQLVLSADLVLTDNEIGYTLAKTLGTVPSLALVNSFTFDELMEREKPGSPIRRLLIRMEKQRANSVFPHKIYPIRAGAAELAEDPDVFRHHKTPRPLPPVSTLRLGRMKSSPFVKAELYGGAETRQVFEQVLCDSSAQELLKKQEADYVERLNRLDDGATILTRLAAHDSLAEHIAL